MPCVGCLPHTGMVIISWSWKGSSLRTTLYGTWLSSSMCNCAAATVVGWWEGLVRFCNGWTPVLPKPPLSRCVTESLSTFFNGSCGKSNMISCAIPIFLSNV